MNSDRPLRVLHLPVNIRWIMDATIKGQEELGIETKKFLTSSRGVDDPSTERFYYAPRKNQGASKVEYLRQVFRYFKQYWDLLRWADVVHWQYSHRLWANEGLLKNLDFFLIKLLRKPAIVQFHGGDFVDGDLAMIDSPWWHEAYDPEFMSSLTENARKTQKNFAKADFIFALYISLLRSVKRENTSRVFILERVRDLTNMKPSPLPLGERITIAHCPSNPSVKGTRYVVAAIESLQKKYPINFVLIEGKTNEEVLESIRHADIVIDGIISGGYGLLSVEAMALGRAVLARVPERNRAYYPDEMPVISVSPTSLVEVLEDLINNPQKIRDAAEAGPSYVQQMHSIESLTPEILRAYRLAAQRKRRKSTVKRIDAALQLCSERGWKGISDKGGWKKA